MTERINPCFKLNPQTLSKWRREMMGQKLLMRNGWKKFAWFQLACRLPLESVRIFLSIHTHTLCYLIFRVFRGGWKERKKVRIWFSIIEKQECKQILKLKLRYRACFFSNKLCFFKIYQKWWQNNDQLPNCFPKKSACKQVVNKWKQEV